MIVKPAKGIIAWLLRASDKYAVTLPPFGVYILPEHMNTPWLIRHERCHWMQAQRMGVVKFYVVYVWLWLRFGYANHPMEKEARQFEKP